MDIFHDTVARILAGGTVAAIIAFLLYQPTGLVKWLQKKNYQYEVTFSLYMLTPTEKFIFNSILFLTLSMFTLAVTLYLPDHIAHIAYRTYYYFAGDAAISDISTYAADSVREHASKASDALLGAATSIAGTAYQAAANATAAAQEAVSHAAETVGWT